MRLFLLWSAFQPPVLRVSCHLINRSNPLSEFWKYHKIHSVNLAKNMHNSAKPSFFHNLRNRRSYQAQGVYFDLRSGLIKRVRQDYIVIVAKRSAALEGVFASTKTVKLPFRDFIRQNVSTASGAVLLPKLVSDICFS